MFEREREAAKARFAVDERAREECFWVVRRWRRVCWRRVRMHDVQSVEEDMICVLVLVWVNGGDMNMGGEGLRSPSQIPSMGKFNGKRE